MKVMFNLPEHKLDYTYRTNFKMLLLDCERLHITVTFHTHSRQYLEDYKAIDTTNKPISLNHFYCQGELIFYNLNEYEWKNIDIDSIDYIEVEKAPNLEWFSNVAK